MLCTGYATKTQNYALRAGYATKTQNSKLKTQNWYYSELAPSLVKLRVPATVVIRNLCQGFI
nr:MAG: hypothetical protein EDM05_07230 [Leptolyngbya sp. IPPAS B-1204]